MRVLETSQYLLVLLMAALLAAAPASMALLLYSYNNY